MKVSLFMSGLPYVAKDGTTLEPHARVEVEFEEALELVRAGIANFEDHRQTVETMMLSRGAGRSLEQASAVHAAALAEKAAEEEQPRKNGKKGG